VLAGLLAASCLAGPPPVAPFSDVTDALGLPLLSDQCLAFRDLDGDGDPDLLLAPVDGDGVFTGRLALLLNEGGRFMRHDVALDLKRLFGCSVADLDGDGRLDIVAGGRSVENGGPAVRALLRTTTTAFTESALFPPRTGLPGNEALDWEVASVTAVDADSDGDADVVFGCGDDDRASDYSGCDVRSAPSDIYCPLVEPVGRCNPRLLVNDGGGRFEYVPEVLPGRPVRTSRVNPVDVDGDGKLELYLSNDWDRNQLLRPTEGVWVDLLPGWAANPLNHGMGAASGDFDGDGRIDIYVADVGPDQLWRGTPDGLVDVAHQTGVADITAFHVGWEPVAADLDDDGDLDLFVPNSGMFANAEEIRTMLVDHQFPTQLSPQVDFVLWNDGTGRFTHSIVPHRSPLPSFDEGFAGVADYDADGRLDIAVLFAFGFGEFRLLHGER